MQAIRSDPDVQYYLVLYIRKQKEHNLKTDKIRTELTKTYKTAFLIDIMRHHENIVKSISNLTRTKTTANKPLLN